MSTAKDPADLQLGDLEERVAAIFELPESAQAAAFADLRAGHPDHAVLLERWEHAALAVDEAARPSLLLSGVARERASMPERIGRYRILDVLGEGGMGVVYLAEQREPDFRRVALKVIREGMDPNVLVRFEAEREAVAMMHHPYIAEVLDAGATAEGRPYFVLEHVAGMSITDHCERLRLGLQERIALFQKICAGVQHAHEQNVIHRDLKPGNILVQTRGGEVAPKIIDFGVAKALEQRLIERTLYTEPGRILGTPEYMSPEQAETSGVDVDARTDVYSLGVVLYELLTGQLPFESAELRRAGYVEMQRTIREDEPMRPSTRCSTLDAERAATVAAGRRTDLRSLVHAMRGNLDWIVLRCLEKDPTRRYASAADLASDLQRHLDGHPVEAGPPSVRRRALSWSRRHRGVVLSAVVAVLALLATRSLWQSPVSAQPTYTTTHFEIPTALAVFGVHRTQIDFTPDGGLAVHTRKPEDTVRRGGGIAVWDRTTGVSRPLALPGTDEWDYHSPRWSPTADRIALLGLRRTADSEAAAGLFVFDEATGELEQLHRTTRAARAQDLCWSRDGRRITYVSREWALYDVDLAGKHTRWPITTSSRDWQLGGYSPDGRWLLFHARSVTPESHDLWVMPAGGGRAERLTSIPGTEHSARFAPDGASVWFVVTSGSAVANHADNLFRIAFDTKAGRPSGPIEQVTFHDNARLSDLAFIGSGEDVICSVQHERTEILARAEPWSPAGTRPRRIAQGFDVTLSPDGAAIFFTDHAADRNGLFVIDRHGEKPPTRLATWEGAAAGNGNYHLRRDGQAIVLGAADDDGPGVFVLAVEASPTGGHQDSAPRRLASTTSMVFPRWSPDGSTIAYIDADEFVVLNATTKTTRPVATSIWGWEPWTIRWSPDGSSMIAVGYETPAERDGSSNGVFLVTHPQSEFRRITPLTAGQYKENVEWHPSGAFLTAVTHEHQIRRVYPDGRPTDVLLDEPGHVEYRGNWHPDGHHFVFLCFGGADCKGGIHVHDMRTGSVRHEALEFDTVPRWNQDGTVAAWTSKSRVRHFEWLRGVR